MAGLSKTVAMEASGPQEAHAFKVNLADEIIHGVLYSPAHVGQQGAECTVRHEDEGRALGLRPGQPRLLKTFQRSLARNSMPLIHVARTTSS